jgi:LysR family transcriptional regulator, low CO2-responsive transcriptional regulator
MRQRKIQRYFRHGVLPQLRVFEAVARHGNFTRAAAELHLAQPTVSLHIKKLTETVGLPLLERRGNRVCPTEIGAALGTVYADLFGAFARFEDRLCELSERRGGTLKITAGTNEKYIVPRLLAEFVQRSAGIEVSLQVLPRQGVLARLANDADDLYVLTDPPQSEALVARPVLPNPFIVLARRDHPLAGAKSIPFSRFAQEPLLVREPGSSTRAVVDRIFAERGLEPRVRMELGSNEAIKEAILAGMGMAVLARYSLGLRLDQRELTVLDVEGFPIELNWHFVYLAGKRLSPVARAFVEMVRHEAKSLLKTRSERARRFSPEAGEQRGTLVRTACEQGDNDFVQPIKRGFSYETQ